LFINFVEDLLITLYLPLWPASELVLLQLTTDWLKLCNSPETLLKVRLSCIKLLGKIAARIKHEQVLGISNNLLTLVQVGRSTFSSTAIGATH
jgi:hypothetical protein